jgi:hypothetical protein
MVICSNGIQVLKRTKVGRDLLQQRAATLLQNLFWGDPAALASAAEAPSNDGGGRGRGSLARLTRARFGRWRAVAAEAKARDAETLRALAARFARKWQAKAEVAARRRLAAAQRSRVAALVARRVAQRNAAAQRLQRR